MKNGQAGRLLASATLCAFLLFGGAGCTTAYFYATPGNQVVMTSSETASKGTPVSISAWYVFTPMNVDVQELLHQRVGSGKRVENVRIYVVETVGDFFLNLITLGMATSQHVVVYGDVVGN